MERKQEKNKNIRKKGEGGGASLSTYMYNNTWVSCSGLTENAHTAARKYDRFSMQNP